MKPANSFWFNSLYMLSFTAKLYKGDEMRNKNNYKKINLKSCEINGDLVSLISKEYAKMHCVFPFGIEGNNLRVAMKNEKDHDCLLDLKLITKKNIIPFIDSSENIFYCIEKFYGNKFLHNMKDEDDRVSINLTDLIIDNAIAEEASDIHIEPFHNYCRIRYRINGSLKEFKNLSLEIFEKILRRIKILSGIDISKKLLPCDGKFSLNKFDNNYDFRISTIPTIYGEKIVMRILNKNSFDYSLDGITDDEKIKYKFKSILKNNNGIIFLAGPTGAGKSSTLYTFINELNSKNKNIITIEDPVEFKIDGVNQVNVNNKSGLTFATGLRSILRQDPDSISIGEVRDLETADIAIKAAITGHLVLSTIHTSNAVSTINRLQNMRIKNYLLSDAIVSIISQRLVRINCPHCKKEQIIDDEDKKIHEISSQVKLYKGMGCQFCNHTGYIGRKAIFEILEMSERIRKLIVKCSVVSELYKAALDEGMTSLNQTCKNMMLNGETSYEEYLNIIYSIR